MNEQIQQSYDVAPYMAAAIPETHPGRLATVGLLCGLQPAPVERCRVLEIGCATGGNLVPMAHGLPGSELLGIDISGPQIRMARELAEGSGVTNVRFERVDILDFPSDAGEFDYILAHGVYSWVPERVREALLEICRKHLSPQGLAFISYNANPGWHLRQPMREMLRFHTYGLSDAGQRVAAARTLLDFLAEASAAMAETSPSLKSWAAAIADEAKAIGGRPDFYLLHEHLEEVDEAFHLWEFAGQVAAHELVYLGDVDLTSFSPSVLEAEHMERLRALMPPGAPLEQYYDFITGRPFRQSIVAKRSAGPVATVSGEAITGCAVRANCDWLGPDDADFDPGSWVLGNAAGARVRISSEKLREAFQIVRAALPGRIPVRALFEELVAKREPSQPSLTLDWLTRSILRLAFVVGRPLELSTHVPKLPATVPERPRAPAHARIEAAMRPRVANLVHENVALAPAEQFLLQYLDGTRDVTALARVIEVGIPAEEIANLTGGSVPSAKELTEMLLTRMLEMGLIEGGGRREEGGVAPAGA